MVLNDEQKKLAEKNHSLIYGFANKYNLDLDDWYGILAIGLCKASYYYNPNSSKFSTLAYIAMKSEMNAEIRSKFAKKRKIMLKTHLSDDDALYEDNELIDECDIATINDILANPKYREVAELLMLEYSISNIMEKLNLSRTQINNLIKEMREKYDG